MSLPTTTQHEQAQAKRKKLEAEMLGLMKDYKDEPLHPKLLAKSAEIAHAILDEAHASR